MMRKCEVCEKEIKVLPCHIRKGVGRFCSRKCFGVHVSRNNKKEGNPNWKGGDNCVICEECGILFDVRNGYKKRRFCSMKCMGRNRSKTNLGKNNPHWKGGNRKDLHLIRESVRYLKWRQDVFFRDRWQCVVCGYSGKKLNAHHIKRFSDLVDEIKTLYPDKRVIDVANEYTPLWDVSNGITLCRGCHISEHMKE